MQETTTIISKMTKKQFWNEMSTCQIDKAYTVAFLTKYAEKLNWKLLSANSSVNWTMELVNQFKDYIVFSEFSYSIFQIFITQNSFDELIDTYGKHINWKFATQYLTKSHQIYFIKNYYNEWDQLSQSTNIKWDLDDFNNYKHLIIWKEFSRHCNPATFTCYNNLNEFENFLNSNKKNINWHSFSKNKKINWNKKFILFCSHRVNWDALSANQKVPITRSMILEFKDLWNWEILITRTHFLHHYNSAIWTVELVDKLIEFIPKSKKALKKSKLITQLAQEKCRNKNLFNLPQRELKKYFSYKMTIDEIVDNLL